LIGKLEVKRPLRRSRCKWEAIIKVDLRETVWEDVAWIQLAQERDEWRDVVSTVMTFRVPLNVGNLLSGSATAGFSRRAQFYAVT
jgi:hypothetical protein